MSDRANLFLRVAILLVLLAGFLIWNSQTLGFLWTMAKPASSLASDLDSGDPDAMREALGMLMSRGNKEYANKAIPLLQHADDYVWFNAALYLGSCNRKEAIPYLIKGLKHPASRAHEECRQLLVKLTGKDFGKVFPYWRNWYETAYPNEKFDWRLTVDKTGGIDSLTWYGVIPIDDVHLKTADGQQVRLAGIESASDASIKKEAAKFLADRTAGLAARFEFNNERRLTMQVFLLPSSGSST